MAYLGKTPSQAVRSRYYFTATGGETSLSGADDNTNTLTFTDGNYVDVALNGVTLVAGTDYNTTTANTIGGLTALAASDVVEVVVYDTFSVFGGNVIGDFTLTNGTFTQNGLAFPTADGSSGQFLKTNGSGSLSFDTVSTDLVSDTTPQLGGDLQSNGNDVVFADNDKAIFGTGSDLQIYHNGSNSLIQDAGTGNLQLIANNIDVLSSTFENVAKFNENADVKLYYDNAEKLATTSSGVSVTGDLSVSGSISGAGKVLQVQQGTFTGTATTTSTTFVDTGISVTITPSSTSSKIYISALCQLAWDNVSSKAAISLFRDSTEIFIGDADGSRSRTTANMYLGEDTRNGWPITVTYLDSPATTSAVTYKIKFRRMDASGTVGINRGIDSYTNSANWGTSASGIQVMEIGA